MQACCFFGGNVSFVQACMQDVQRHVKMLRCVKLCVGGIQFSARKHVCSPEYIGQSVAFQEEDLQSTVTIAQ